MLMNVQKNNSHDSFLYYKKEGITPNAELRMGIASSSTEIVTQYKDCRTERKNDPCDASPAHNGYRHGVAESGYSQWHLPKGDNSVGREHVETHSDHRGE